MIRRFSATFAIFSMILDGAWIGLALRIAVSARPQLNSLPGVETIPAPVILPEVLYFIFPIFWVGLLLAFAVYDGRRNLRVVDEVGSLTGSSLIAMVAMAGVLYLSFRDVSRLLFLFFCFLAFVFLLLWRGVARWIFRWRLRDGAVRRRVLILGAGEGGRRLQELIFSQKHLGLDLVGFLDDCVPEQLVARNVLGPLECLRQEIVRSRVDDVVVALPRSAPERLNWVVSELHDQPVKVWVIPDYFSLALHRASVEEFAGIPMLDLSRFVEPPQRATSIEIPMTTFRAPAREDSRAQSAKSTFAALLSNGVRKLHTGCGPWCPCQRSARACAR